jgi:lysozyme
MSSNPHGHNPRGHTLHGIDVASPQGHGLDWSLVAADNIRYAWMQTDGTFARNWRESRKYGVLRGAYQFYRPEADPIVQADSFLKKMGDLEDDDLHPMFDVEVDHGVERKKILDDSLKWCEHVEARTGRQVVIYTYPSFMVGTLKIKAGDPLGKRPLWMAHYVVDPDNGRVYNLKSPIVPAAWDSWLVWQTSGNKGPRIPGIPMDIDRDVFWGTEAEFRDVFTSERVSAPPDTLPSTPTSKSSDQWRFNLSSAATPIRAGEGEHTVEPEDPDL